MFPPWHSYDDVMARNLDHLVDAARHGDSRALGELVRLTQPQIWKLVSYQATGEDTADLVQETYLKAIRSLDSYRGDASFVGWLSGIARHVCADHVRRRMRRRRLHQRLSGLAHDFATNDASPIDDLIAVLSPDRREAFVLTQLVGLSYDEAAQACGCPVGTIRSRVARARADLIELVNEQPGQRTQPTSS
jgi:RNA polymerase sigma-70 factor, ECF subfamily